MKLALILTILTFSCVPVFAQERPLTQAEYVKMLYALQKAPATKIDIIDALRKRGIAFALTDGIRGLTRSKGGNDEDLKRALEEAERRRQNPTAAKLPTELEVVGIIDKTRRKTLAAVEEMPDFVVKQQIQRSEAFAGTGNFRSRDKLVVAVSYRSSGQEEYKILSKDGVPQPAPEAKRGYEEVGGTSSTGEFVTMLATIFKAESDATFDIVDTDVIRGRRTAVFDFAVERDKAKQQIVCKDVLTESALTGMKGRIWIDREDFRVLRIESEATEIPAGFACPSAKRNIEYDWTTIADERFLLPMLSDVRLTFRGQGKVYESRNLIRFTNYQKFGTEIILGEEDAEPVKEEKP